MAIGTRLTGIVDLDTLPEDMQVFTVIGGTIKDSMDEYCEDGQEAALTEKDAKHYYKLKAVQAAMPEFKKVPVAQSDKGQPDADEPAASSGAETQAATGANRRQARS